MSLTPGEVNLAFARGPESKGRAGCCVMVAVTLDDCLDKETTVVHTARVPHEAPTAAC